MNVEHGPNSSGVSEATVKLVSRGETIHTVAEGDGPVNALDAALRSGGIAAIDLRWPSTTGLSTVHVVAADRFRFWRRRRPLVALLGERDGRAYA